MSDSHPSKPTTIPTWTEKCPHGHPDEIFCTPCMDEFSERVRQKLADFDRRHPRPPFHGVHRLEIPSEYERTHDAPNRSNE